MGGKINFSTSLAGQAVGVKEVDGGIWLVSFMNYGFMNYDLGYIDLEEKTLQPLQNSFGPKVQPMSPERSVTHVSGTEMGHGFLESVYEQAFAGALAQSSVFFQRQIAVPVWFHRPKAGDFRADLVVERRIIIGLKTGREIDPAWEKQLLNYLRATEIEVGLLFNFGPKARFRRHVFENQRKNLRGSAGIRGEEVAGDKRESAEGK